MVWGATDWECGYRRTTEGIPVVVEVFCSLTLSLSTSLWSRTKALQAITTGSKLGKEYKRALYHFLQLHVLLTMMSKQKCLMLKNQLAKILRNLKTKIIIDNISIKKKRPCVSSRRMTNVLNEDLSPDVKM